MLPTLSLLVCIGAGIVGGAFFAFSTFVMRALAQLPGRQGMAAMQRINIVVLNPVFLSVFLGTAILAAACVVASFIPWSPPRSVLLLVVGVGYLAGCFGVTMTCNVPCNERLAGMKAESAEAAAYWPVYVREWLFWNHVRTAASLIAAACAAAALAN